MTKTRLLVLVLQLLVLLLILAILGSRNKIRRRVVDVHNLPATQILTRALLLLRLGIVIRTVKGVLKYHAILPLAVVMTGTRVRKRHLIAQNAINLLAILTKIFARMVRMVMLVGSSGITILAAKAVGALK